MMQTFVDAYLPNAPSTRAVPPFLAELDMYRVYLIAHSILNIFHRLELSEQLMDHDETPSGAQPITSHTHRVIAVSRI